MGKKQTLSSGLYVRFFVHAFGLFDDKPKGINMRTLSSLGNCDKLDKLNQC